MGGEGKADRVTAEKVDRFRRHFPQGREGKTMVLKSGLRLRLLLHDELSEQVVLHKDEEEERRPSVVEQEEKGLVTLVFSHMPVFTKNVR